jgi:predicted DNA-binding protein (MmcQ/YjbR family)
MTKSATTLAKAEKALRHAGMKFPEVTEDFPWGHRALKVKGKALALPFASPTAYGLAKSGWVTARFQRSDRIPLALLCTWMEESYQAVAPKSLVALLTGGGPVKRTARTRRTRRARQK